MAGPGRVLYPLWRVRGLSLRGPGLLPQEIFQSRQRDPEGALGFRV